jgi:hypothetical protein
MKCFEYNKQKNKICDNTGCKHFINCKKDNNCTIVAASKGTKTLQEVGEIFGVTRMRICQIEKEIMKKIKKSLSVLQ